MARYRLKSDAIGNKLRSDTIVKANLAKKPVKKAPPKNMKKYLVLQLEGCQGCRAKKSKSGARPSIDDLKHFAKVEVTKLDRFNIDTRQINTACPECNNKAMFHRVKWWGAGFQDNTSICLDSKGRKKMKVSDIKDITNNFLEYREATIKNEISIAEGTLNRLKDIQKSLKSATKRI